MLRVMAFTSTFFFSLSINFDWTPSRNHQARMHMESIRILRVDSCNNTHRASPPHLDHTPLQPWDSTSCPEEERRDMMIFHYIIRLQLFAGTNFCCFGYCIPNRKI